MAVLKVFPVCKDQNDLLERTKLFKTELQKAKETKSKFSLGDDEVEKIPSGDGVSAINAQYDVDKDGKIISLETGATPMSK